jgi:hypothetical protein
MYLILPAAIGPGDYSAYNRNEYRKHGGEKMFLAIFRCVRYLTHLKMAM